MSRLDSIFCSGKKALMPFIVAGDPSLEVTEDAICTMAAAGADIIELGIPFSDPIADGPVIAAAMQKALQNEVTTTDIVDLVSRVRSKVDVGLVAMMSYSLIHRAGWKSCIDAFATAGIDGFIIPDIDVRDAKEVSEYCNEINVSFSMLVSPTTPIERIEHLASLSSGFLYVLARTGLTGEQKDMPDLAPRMAEIRAVTNLPLAVGFGISNRDHVQIVQETADAAIVGSALVRRMQESSDPATAASQFVSEIS